MGAIVVIILIIIIVLIYINSLNAKSDNDRAKVNNEYAFQENLNRLQNPSEEKKKNEIINAIVYFYNDTEIIDLRSISANVYGGYKMRTTFKVPKNDGYLRNVMIETTLSFELIIEVWKHNSKRLEEKTIYFTIHDEIEDILNQYKSASNQLLTYLD